jgi:hypothetical protein
VSSLKNSGWADAIAPGTELEIQVRESATCHRLTVGQIQRWCDGRRREPRPDAEEAQIEAAVGLTATAIQLEEKTELFGPFPE